MSEPTMVSWFKVPIIGVPGFPGCDVRVIDGSAHGPDGEPWPLDAPAEPCGQDTVWMIGKAHVCRQHFPLVAELTGDTAEAIEQAWRDSL